LSERTQASEPPPLEGAILPPWLYDEVWTTVTADGRIWWWSNGRDRYWWCESGNEEWLSPIAVDAETAENAVGRLAAQLAEARGLLRQSRDGLQLCLGFLGIKDQPSRDGLGDLANAINGYLTSATAAAGSTADTRATIEHSTGKEHES
jgi:hypothetical protein